jgi:hypothetical protein
MALIAAAAASGGCEKRSDAEPFGKTFYVGGASNWDVLYWQEVPDGLRDAGYQGHVETFIWTASFVPIVDQLLTINAKARAKLLALQIEQYKRRYPKNQVNLISLSAGTGVAVWALESLHPGVQVDNLVMLSSSLSADYDVRQALEHVKGKIYVFCSAQDAVLEAVRVVGTIDGQIGVDSAGQVGLQQPKGMEDRIVNTKWNRQYLRYAWAGGHTDCINRKFIGGVVAPLILPSEPVHAGQAPVRHQTVASTSQPPPDQTP